MSDYTLEEIEAAAKAIHDTVEAQYVKAGMRLTWGSKQQDPTTRECYREQARAALATADNAEVQRLIDEELAPISAERDEVLAEVARLEDWLAVASREAVDARAAFEKERHENQLLEADLTVAVHEAIVARAKLAGHYCGGRDKA